MKLRNIKILIILLFGSFASYSQTSPTIGVGIVREKVDSNITKSIKIISTGIGDIIGFPAEYSIRRESDYPDSIKGERTYFTPDSLTLLAMNEELKKQYCFALRYQVEESYQSSLRLFGKNKFDEGNFKRWRNQVISTCGGESAALDSMCKQVIAFTSKKYNGSILFIQLIDFREDPYKLQESSKKQMIDGWHGWFETNIKCFYYHIGQRKLSVHGDDFKKDNR
jgi:hypothetical protein